MIRQKIALIFICVLCVFKVVINLNPESEIFLYFITSFTNSQKYLIS